MSTFISLFILGYLLGSIPWGYLISKPKGIDIRKVGSGNIGANNVIRVLGLKWGLLVGILDILKGVIPAFLATRFLIPDWQIAIVALSPILGHIFPVWFKIKGGKGVATTVGVLLVLLEPKLFLIWLIFWLLILSTSQIMSFTNLFITCLLPLLLWFSSSSISYFILGFVLWILIWWSHRQNLERIKKGVEPKFQIKNTT